MVFDGSPLPSKRGTETSRHESRAKHKAKGLALLRAGKRGQAIECFQKAVDVTPQMAKRVIDACKAEGVEVIVAPLVNPQPGPWQIVER
jgi:exonuclease-1